MGRIYRSCKGVLVYLGDGVGRYMQRRVERETQGHAPPIVSFSLDGEKLPTGFGSIKDMENIDKAYSDTLEVFKFIKSLSNGLHVDPLQPLGTNEYFSTQFYNLNLFESLRQLTHAPFTPWWTRIWVVQETVLPPEITLICGAISASWGLFSSAAEQYEHHVQNCCSGIIDRLPRDHLKVLKSFSQKIQELQEMRCIMKGYILTPRGDIIIPTTQQSKGLRSLLSLLRRFQNRKASDPRDKVYALLSLVEDGGAIVPDYSLTEVQVFQQAALDSIYDSGSLSILQGDISRKFRQDLPSWVPDWEASDYRIDHFRIGSTNLYDTCSRQSINKNTVTSTDRILFVDRIIVDEVNIIGGVMLSEEVDAVLNTLSDWTELLDTYEDYPWHQKLNNFWRALCADIVSHAGGIRRAIPEDEYSFASWMLLSALSPFSFRHPWPRSSDLLHYYQSKDFLSENARIQRFLVLLKMAVDTQDNELAGQALKEVGSTLNMYLPGFEDVLFDFGPETHSHTRDNESKRLSREEAAMYGMLGFRELVVRERRLQRTAPGLENIKKSVRENEQRAWNQMSWKSLLNHITTSPTLQGNFSILEVDLAHQVSIMDQSIISATKSRRLFITKGGCIGLAPAQTAVGDQLCLIEGGRTPFILRDKQSDLACREPTYELIGDCYADGLMDAEGLDRQVFNLCNPETSNTWKIFYSINMHSESWVIEEAAADYLHQSWERAGLV